MALDKIPLKDIGTRIQMVGAVYASPGGKAWVVLFPGEPTPEVEFVPLDQEEWIRFLKQTDLVEVEVMVKDPETKALGKALVRKSERVISQITSWTVFRRDGFRCRYCGVEDQPLTVDHLITWESGGPSVPENLVSACKKCNSARGDMAYEQWLHDPYYKRVSQGLSFEERFKNQGLIPALARIPITVRVGKRSR